MTKLLILLLLALPADRSEADRLYDAGDWAGARTLYQALLPEVEENGERAGILLRIGRTCLEEGAYWDAETWFSKSLEAEETAAAHLARGQAFLYAGIRSASDPTAFGAEVQSLMNDAARELERAIRLAPGDAAPWVSLGYVERYRRDSDAEERAFRRAHEIDPADPEAILQVAWFEERDGRIDRARELLRAVPAETRTLAHQKALGRLASTAGDDGAAVEAWRAALDLDPGDPESYLGLWNVTGREKRFAEFNRDMQAILERSPDLWLPHYYLGFSLRYDGRPREAVEQFLKAQRRAGDEDVRPITVAADVLLIDLTQEDEAILLYLDLLDRDPGNARALEVLALLAYQRAQAKDFESAERLYSELLENEPGNWSHATNLALVYKETDRIEKAVALYRETAERFPFEPQILNDLGLLFLGLGRGEEGKAALREALDRDPEFLDSLENLGALARLDGRYEDARAFFHRAFERVRKEGGDTSKFRRYLDMVTRELEGVR